MSSSEPRTAASAPSSSGSVTPDGRPTSADPAGPADLAAGTFDGAVIADSTGPSRSDVTVTIAKVDKWTVRVTSDYARLGSADVALTRIGEKLFNASGDATLVLDLTRTPATLDYNPGGVAYHGTKRR